MDVYVCQDRPGPRTDLARIKDGFHRTLVEPDGRRAMEWRADRLAPRPAFVVAGARPGDDRRVRRAVGSGKAEKPLAATPRDRTNRDARPAAASARRVSAWGAAREQVRTDPGDPTVGRGTSVGSRPVEGAVGGGENSLSPRSGVLIIPAADAAVHVRPPSSGGGDRRRIMDSRIPARYDALDLRHLDTTDRWPAT